MAPGLAGMRAGTWMLTTTAFAGLGFYFLDRTQRVAWLRQLDLIAAQPWAKDHKVGLAPGEAFGPGGEGNVRLCFASGPERLSQGLDRVEAAIRAL